MTVLGHRSTRASVGASSIGGVLGHGTPDASITSDEALASRRPDHLGLTLERRKAVLATELPYGTTFYIGLFSEMPDRRGIGGTQVALDRVPIDRWVSVVRGAAVHRTNAISLQWGPIADSVTVLGWGAWTAATDGVLRVFDFLRTDLDEPVGRYLTAGMLPGIASGRIGLVL